MPVRESVRACSHARYQTGGCVFKGNTTRRKLKDLCAVSAIAPAAPLVPAPLGAAFWGTEVHAAAIGAASIRACPFLAGRDRGSRSLGQLTLLTNRATRRFEHFEKALIDGLRLLVVGRARHDLA